MLQTLTIILVKWIFHQMKSPDGTWTFSLFENHFIQNIFFAYKEQTMKSLASTTELIVV